MVKEPINVKEKTVAELKDLWGKVPMIGIDYQVTHEDEHFEEMVTGSIYKRYGHVMFPECKNIPVGFLSNQAISDFLKGNTEDSFWKMLNRGFLCYGMAGGPFDDHKEENMQECAATLMAKFLGVRNNPELSRLLKYTLNTDKKGDTFWAEENLDQKTREIRNAAQSLLPGRLVKEMWRLAKNEKWSHEKICSKIECFHEIIDIEIESQQSFYRSRNELDEKSIEVFEVGKDSVVIMVESDLFKVESLARQKVSRKKEYRNKKKLTVVLNPTTNNFMVQNELIPTKKVEERDFVKYIQYTVAQKRGLKPRWEDLGKENIEGIPELFYHAEHRNLFNGTNSHPQPGIYGLIDKNDFKEAIKYGLQNQLHEEFLDSCKSGHCNHECPLWNIGLSQCAEARRYKGLPKTA